MAQSVSAGSHEDLKSDLLHPCKNVGVEAQTCNPGTRVSETGGFLEPASQSSQIGKFHVQ